MDLSPTWYGAIGSATLFGLFAGSPLFGWVTDRMGRKLLFLAHLLARLILSPVQLLVVGPVDLFAVRFLIGMAIGADFTIAMSLLSELVPRKQRGSLLASLNVLAIVGLALAYPAKAALDVLGDHSWRWLLASSAVPTAIVLLLRMGAPEAPAPARQAGGGTQRPEPCSTSYTALTSTSTSPSPRTPDHGRT